MAEPRALPALGPIGAVRWAWRQLTSMRTALFLLLLVAVAAVPGSIWPQRSVDAGRVETYLAENPGTGPWLDRLGLFDVYTSPWFSAIYLLLMLSLIGCVVPRTALHWHAVRSAPPRAPQRLDRLPVSASFEVDGTVADVTGAARRILRRRRYRLRPAPTDGAGEGVGGVVAAETGYLRETGNLLFHVAILLLTMAMAWSYLSGWRGDKIVPVGQSFANALGGYHTWSAGPWVRSDALSPFTVRIDRLDVSFEESGRQQGAPRDFTASTTVTAYPGATPEQHTLKVNEPLSFGTTSVYLLGNGYAPVVTVRDAAGQVLYREATPFLPQDNLYRSTGAIKVVGASPRQLGFTGVFLPTAYVGTDGVPASAFPDLRRPAMVLSLWEGDLFPGGAPQSVYALPAGMTRVNGADGSPLQISLQPGETVQLPGGRGSISLDSVDRWAGVSVRDDPAKPLALTSALLALAGLVASLLVRRRRIFVRVRPVEDTAERGPRVRIDIGAIAKNEDPMLADVVAQLVERLGGPAADGDSTVTLVRSAPAERRS